LVPSLRSWNRCYDAYQRQKRVQQEAFVRLG
jgi:hypothetical protein